MCNIDRHPELLALIRDAKLILWDEAVMANRRMFEAVERSLKQYLGNETPFGGKLMVFGGDFRQILPVVVRGTAAQTVAACINKAYFWRHVRCMRLIKNMRVQNLEARGMDAN